jgi:hypothetical protein
MSDLIDAIRARHVVNHWCIGVDPIMGPGRRSFGLEDGVPCDMAVALAEIDRLTEARDTLAGLLESALAGMAKAGHIVTDDGYCPACGGGCLLGFTNPAPEVPFAEPSPFGARP